MQHYRRLMCVRGRCATLASTRTCHLVLSCSGRRLAAGTSASGCRYGCGLIAAAWRRTRLLRQLRAEKPDTTPELDSTRPCTVAGSLGRFEKLDEFRPEAEEDVVSVQVARGHLLACLHRALRASRRRVQVRPKASLPAEVARRPSRPMLTSVRVDLALARHHQAVIVYDNA